MSPAQTTAGSRAARRLTIGAAAGLAIGAAAGPAPAEVLLIVDNPALGEFIDIVDAGGEQVFLGPDGEAEIVEDFAGNFVLRPGSVVAGQNGGVGFGQRTVTDLEPENEPLPSVAAFIGTQAALAYWDDIDDKDGEIHFLQLNGDPDLGDRLIVQWTFHDFDGRGSVLGFQVHALYNDGPTGVYAQLAYRIEGPAAGAGTSATIGYQDGMSGFDDVQFSFNTAGAVGDGTVLSLILPEPADLDRNGSIDTVDFLLLLDQWGPCRTCRPCAADLDGDCQVGVRDLLILLQGWG